MFRYISFLFLLASCFFATRAAWAAPAVADLPPGYVVGARIALTPTKDGFEGAAELLEDGRIGPSGQGALMQFYFVGEELADARLARLMEIEPLKPALLRLIDGKGRVAERVELESPFAKLVSFGALAPLRDHAQLSLTRGGFGSVLEEMTALVSFREGRIRALVFTDPESGEAGTLELVRRTKTDWKADPQAKAPGFLQIVCRPGSGAESGFVERYLRYRLEGGRLIRKAAERTGYCEWDGFPPAESFP